MSLSQSPQDEDVIDDRDDALNNMKQVLPDDVKIQVSDGEVWANKALLMASSEYFSVMLDEEKFKEGKEGVGSLKKYSKEVVSKVIKYFYSGKMSCQVKFGNLCHCGAGSKNNFERTKKSLKLLKFMSFI